MNSEEKRISLLEAENLKLIKELVSIKEYQKEQIDKIKEISNKLIKLIKENDH